MPCRHLATIASRGNAVSTLSGTVVRCGTLEAAIEKLPGVCHAFAHAAPDWEDIVAIMVMETVGQYFEQKATSVCFDAKLVSKKLETELRMHSAWGAVEAAAGGVKIQLAVALDPWTVSNGLLSGELKKRRGGLLHVYASALQNIHMSAKE